MVPEIQSVIHAGEELAISVFTFLMLLIAMANILKEKLKSWWRVSSKKATE